MNKHFFLSKNLLFLTLGQTVNSIPNHIKFLILISQITLDS